MPTAQNELTDVCQGGQQQQDIVFCERLGSATVYSLWCPPAPLNLPCATFENSQKGWRRGRKRGGGVCAGRRNEREKRAGELEWVKLARLEWIHNIVNNTRATVSHGCCSFIFKRLCYAVVLRPSSPPGSEGCSWLLTACIRCAKLTFLMANSSTSCHVFTLKRGSWFSFHVAFRS